MYDTYSTDGKTEVQRCQSLACVYEAGGTQGDKGEPPQKQHLSRKTPQSRSAIYFLFYRQRCQFSLNCFLLQYRCRTVTLISGIPNK